MFTMLTTPKLDSHSNSCISEAIRDQDVVICPCSELSSGNIDIICTYLSPYIRDLIRGWRGGGGIGGLGLLGAALEKQL